MKKHNPSLSKTICYIFSLISLFTFGLASCSRYNDNHDHAELTTGKALFNHHCANCHGEDGTGKLADQTPANILTQKGRLGIADYVTKNVNPNRKMPVFENMPATEADRIASHLLQLKRTYNNMPDEQKKNRRLLIEP